ncbi:MAG TPA: deoxyguanosinetriphosphate triphosphohydrolase [Spirochaetota bacterium]|nr:deoxyguanosinetriphosphate triphosphohydrolase [Spirochaetota bacterium]HRU64595.1 deoxyguanosinetriphosphate triphosphohydrolase [Spirochaetota bacterium]
MKIADRNFLQDLEEKNLAPYAAKSRNSRGREHPENSHLYRTEYQRDRERIIHCRAFRRLEYKTQVFINHEGDHYRTRLTHTMEVAQISRAVSRALRLNEDLAESIALAHDLGHTPFGHVGERELNKLLKDYGGFEHNRQSLRVVEILEKRYADFDGLNLTWETREGIIKHSTPYDKPESNLFNPQEQPSLEAQIIDIADEIAYNNHDLDDGLSSGLLSFKEVGKLPIWQYAVSIYGKPLPLSEKSQWREIIRTLINILVTDLINTTIDNINSNNIKTYDDVKNFKCKLASFSREIEELNDDLKKFLKTNLYQHYRVTRMSLKSQKIINELFHIYTEHPDTLPGQYKEEIEKNGVYRTVTDFIAGMTDRFAIEEHKKLTDPSQRV